MAVSHRDYNYTDEKIVSKAKEVYSLSALLRSLGLRAAGGNFSNMKRNLQRLNVNTSHWTGQGWNIGQQLKDFSQYTHIRSAKKHLVNLRGHRCESCNLSEWLGKPIMLEIDHTDGDITNNELTNLKLLCPNCHAQTPTWRGRKQLDVPKALLKPDY